MLRAKQSGAGFLVLITVLALMGVAQASEDLLRRADEAAQSGRLADMQRLYEEVLETEPGNNVALSGRAAALAWQGSYQQAQAAYLHALESHPDDPELHNGLGYAYAWNGEFSNARREFNKSLQLDPANLSARKGIAYSFHWAGQHDTALEFFQVAENIAPADAEIAEAAGHASLAMGRSRDAANYFDRALEIDPARQSAYQARRAAYTYAPLLEISTRFSNTNSGESGLRALELGHWPAATTRFGIRYDNSLGLDNTSIADRGRDAPSYYASVMHRFSNRWLGKLEVGRRDLIGGDQDVVTLEVGYQTGLGAIGVGAQLGEHSAGYRDQLLFGSYGFPLGQAFRIEPALYIAQTGATRDDEWRGVLKVEYRPTQSWVLGAFAGGGDVSADNPAFTGSTRLFGIQGDMNIGDQATLHFGARREDTPADNFSIAEIGFTYRLAGNQGRP